MNVMSHSLSTEADVLRWGYAVGYFDNADIELWADRQIAATEKPCLELLDLSMIRHTHPLDVMKLLRSLGTSDPATTVETQIGFLGLLYGRQEITAYRAICELYALVHEAGITADQESEIYYLDDAFDLAAAGTFGTINDFERKLTGFLSPYAEQLAERHSQLIPALRTRRGKENG
jgi:hypothetical protein